MTLFRLLLLGRGGLRKSVARFPFIFISSPYPPPRAVLRARFSAHFQLTPSLYYLLFCVWSIARNYAKLYVLRLFKGHPQQKQEKKKTLMTAPSPPPPFAPRGINNVPQWGHLSLPSSKYARDWTLLLVYILLPFFFLPSITYTRNTILCPSASASSSSSLQDFFV